MADKFVKICPKCGWIELIANMSGGHCPICSYELINTDYINETFPFGCLGSLDDIIADLQKRFTLSSQSFCKDMWDKRIEDQIKARVQRQNEKKQIDEHNIRICPKCGRVRLPWNRLFILS